MANNTTTISNIQASGGAYVPDATAPRIASIERQTPSTSPTNADSLTWRVTFDETVTNVGDADFSVSGPTGATIGTSGFTGTQVDVTVSGGDMADLDATVTLSFAGGQDITDSAGNALTDTTPTGTNDNTFDVDNFAPLITGLQRNNSASTNLDSVSWLIAFDSAMQNLNAADFQIAGTTATLSVEPRVPGSEYEFNVTASGGNLSNLNGDIALSINPAHDLTDPAGNALTNLVSVTIPNEPIYTIDNIEPLVASIDFLNPATGTTDADSVTWRITFAEAVANITADDFQVDQTTGVVSVSNITATTVDVTVSGGDMPTSNASPTISFAAGQDITDTAGNALTNTFPQGTNNNFYSLDNDPPIVTDIFANNNATVGNTLVTWSISINEDPDNFTIDDFTLVTSAGVTASDLQISQDNGTNAQITANLTGSGTAQLQFNANTDIVDAFGNGNGTNGFAPANTTDPNAVASVDTVAPSVVSITGPSSPTNSDTASWRVTLSENVTGAANGSFTVSGTTAGPVLVNTLDNVIDILVTGGDLASLDGDITLALTGAHGITDIAGNPLASLVPSGTDQRTVTIDNTAPAAPSVPDLAAGSDTGYDDTDNNTNATTPTFTGTAEVGATVTLISSLDGVVGSATADGSGDWSITSSALSENVHTITATATDAASNTSAASAGLSVTIDVTDPSVPSAPDLTAATDTGSSNNDNITSDTTPTLEGTGEPNTGVTLVSSVAGDNLAAGTITSVGVDGSGNWSATLPALADGSRTIIAVAFDAAGNTSTFASGLTLAIDTDAPGLTAFARNTPATEDTDADTLVFDITFDEAVLNTGAADFDITGTTGTGVLAGSGAAYTLTISGGNLADLSSGNVGLNLNTGHGITDAAGNALPDGEPATDETYAVLNTVPPGFTKVFAPDSVAAGGSSTLTFTIDSSANGVAATALDFTDNFPAGMTVASPANAATTCTGGTVTAVSGAGSVNYTGGAVLAGATCTVSVDVTSSTLGDAVNTTGDLTSSLGNSGAATDTLAIIDGTAPRVASIVRHNPTDDTTNADSITWRVTFDEAVTAPASLSNLTNFRDTGSVALRSTYDLEFVEVDGSTYLFGAALGDDAISTILVDSAGSLTNVATTSDSPTVFLDGPYRLGSAVVGGTPYLIASSYYEAGLSVFSIDNAGALTNVDNVADDATLNLWIVSALHTVVVDGTTYLYVADERDDGLSVFTMDALGQLTNIQNISDAGALELDGVGGITSAIVDGTPYLFVAGRFDDGLSVFSIGNDGMLTNVANQDNSGGNLEGAENVSIAVIDGTTFLFVTAQDSDAISAYAVGNDGSLTLADSIADTAELQLDRVNGMATISKDGTTYVLAITRNDDAISAFSVANDGTLTPVAAALQSDNPLFELNNLSALAVRDIDGNVIAISGDADGISAFELLAPGVGSSDFAIDDPAASLAVSAVSASVYDVTASGASIETGNAVRTLSFADDQSIQDIAGNALVNTEPTGANQNEFYLDNSPPIVTDIFANNNATIGNTLVTWFISINEDPDNFTIDDFTLATSAGVTASNLQIAQDGGTNAQITATLTGTGTAQLQFNANTDIVDALGNGNGTNGFAPANTTDPNSTAIVDTVAPTLVSITRETPAGERTNADTLVFDVRFDTPVRNVDAADFVISGTTAGLTVGALVESLPPGIEAPHAAPLSSSWTVTASGGNLSGVNGTVSLALDGASTIDDANGNALTDRTPSGTVETYDVRNQPPAIGSIARLTPIAASTNADSLTWRVTFSAIDNTFDLPTNAFTVSGTTASVTNVSRFSIGFDVTVSGGDLADLNGDVTLGLTNADFADDYGNVMDRTIPAGAELTFTVDNTAPSLTTFARNTPPGEQTNADTLVFDITFDESVSNVSADDFDISGTTGTGVLAGSGSDYTLTISGGDLAELTGTVGLDLADGQDVTDAAGNALGSSEPATNETFDVRNIAPSIASIARLTPADAVTNADSLVWRVTFAQIDGNFDLPTSAFTVSGTSAAVTDVSRSSIGFDVTVSGGDLAGLDGDVTLGLADTDFADDYGNVMDRTIPDIAELAYSLDNAAPMLAITGPTGPVSGAFTATFTFSEAVSDFALIDISVGNGAASDLQTSDNTVFTATITPADDGEVTVDVAADAAEDAAGNGNAAATQFSVENDETAPTLLSIARNTPSSETTDADTLTWRVSFSEAVENVDSGDFTVSGTTATVSDVSDAGGNAFDVTVSGGNLANLNATVTLGVLTSGGIVDAADNAFADATPTGTNEQSYTVQNDTEAPTLTSIVRQDPATELTNADTLTWRVNFSETIENVDAADFTLDGSTASLSVSAVALGLPPSVTGDTAPAPLVLAANAVDVTASGGDLASLDGDVTLGFASGQDISDEAGNTLDDTTASGRSELSYTLDNTAPVITLSSSASGPVAAPFTLDIAISETVTGFALNDLAVTNAVASDLVQTSSGGTTPVTYTALITPSAAGNVSIAVAADVAEDAAGNGNAAADTFSITHDDARALTLTFPGVGEGSVTSSPAGLDCDDDCTADFTAGTAITLTAAADTGSGFASWAEGPCAGETGLSCSFTLTEDTAVAARFTLDNPPDGRIVAATLPAARSGYVGGPVISAFLSVVSRTSSPAQSCQITAPAGAPVTLGYNQLDANGDPIGPDSPLFDIVPGGALNFVIGMTPTAQTAAGGYNFLPVITCDNASLDPIVGVNSVFLTIGAAPAPDILSIAATPSGDGVIRIPAPGRVQFMTAAAVNVGIGDASGAAGEVTLTTTVDTGAASLPLNLEICQINAASICITPRSSDSITSIMTGSDPLFFAAFVRDTSTGGIPFDPANSRVFLRFADATGTIRSATSAAVTAPAPEAAPEIASSLPQGRWSVLMRQPQGVWPGLARASLFITETGQVLIDDGIEPRLTTLEVIAAEAGQDNTQARFMTLGHDGVWTNAGTIRLGAPWTEQVGEFWGVRDARSDVATNWTDLAGTFGDSLILYETGEFRGNIDDCAVYGQASGPATQAVSLTLSGCEASGRYTAALDLPANDSGSLVLLIASGDRGWRLER
ncbi:beta strand repeat-containing protein [Hyphobacterium sp.]|uniref:beta strand repeat-containing protein n=1 Tax=Hyphobacterium sp. TaxID=2004662 RepID=UPI00374A6F2D